MKIDIKNNQVIHAQFIANIQFLIDMHNQEPKRFEFLSIMEQDKFNLLRKLLEQ